MFISPNRTSLLTRISLLIIIIAQVAAMLLWSSAAPSTSTSKGGDTSVSASAGNSGGSQTSKGSGSQTNNGDSSQASKGGGGGTGGSGTNKGGDHNKDRSGDNRKGGANDSVAGTGDPTKKSTKPTSGSVFLTRNPAPPACALNNGTQSETYQFTINYDSTPLSYTNYILDPSGNVVYTTGLAINGHPSPYQSSVLTWTIPSASPIGRYEIVVDYYSLEGGNQYEAEGRVTFYVCNNVGQSIDAYKFYDTNMNGVHDPGEPFLQGWHILFTTPFGDTYTKITDVNGHAVLSSTNGIPAGTYSISETLQAGWMNTTVLPISANVPVGGAGGPVYIGNIQLPTATPTASPTITPTNTPTNTDTPTPAPSATPTDTPTNSPTTVPSNTPTTAPTQTPGGPTATPVPSNTPTTPPTNTPPPAATNTPAPPATNTPAPPATNTPAPPATNTPAPTNTPPAVRTDTPGPRVTNTPAPPTNTPPSVPPTSTPQPPTNTPVLPTNTPQPPTNTPTSEPPTGTPEPPTNTPVPPAPTNTPAPPSGQLTPTPFDETGGLGSPRLPRTGTAATASDDTLPLYLILALGLIVIGTTLRKLTTRRVNS